MAVAMEEDQMNDVKTFTMPTVGGAAVPAALLTGDVQVRIGGELKGTVTATVDSIMAAVQAGEPKEKVLLMCDAAKTHIEEVISKGQVCPECGIGFIRSRGGQVFCSDKCSARRRVRLFKQRKRAQRNSIPQGTLNGLSPTCEVTANVVE